MKKQIKGKIEKIIDNSTIKVSVARSVRHPKYQKKYTITKSYLVDSKDTKKFEIGKEIIIEETKPVSKKKNWRVA